jgi:hypothetical protein
MHCGVDPWWDLLRPARTRRQSAEVEEVAKEKRGREKKRDGKKRKASLLKAPLGASGESSTAVSSMENSPAPVKLRPSTKLKQESPVQDMTASLRSGTFATPTPSTPTVKEARFPTLAVSPAVVAHSTRRSPHLLLAPAEIALPESPIAGPSRLVAPDPDLESLDGEGDFGNTSDSATSYKASGDHSTATPPNGPSNTIKSPGFSIIPEEGYLPVAALAQSSKKKKRKGKSAPTPLPLPDTIKRQSSVDTSESVTQPIASGSPAVPVTPSRHARKASLVRPINADLDELLTERERVIESLRAEIGVTKAEEAKAREEIVRGKWTEDRLKGDIERMRKAHQRSEHEGRQREGEV